LRAMTTSGTLASAMANGACSLMIALRSVGYGRALVFDDVHELGGPAIVPAVAL
jgi:hypothetical protein